MGRPTESGEPNGHAPKQTRTSKAAAAKAEPKLETAGWIIAAEAADSKQARDIQILDLRPVTGFTDYLVVCSGTNPRQLQAIVDETEQRLAKIGENAISIEGYKNAEWILMDYGDFVVNVLSEKARAFYELERLWRDARPVDFHPKR